MIAIFAKHNLLIGVNELIIPSEIIDKKVALGVNIRFNSSYKPDCIKGPKSYYRIMNQASLSEKRFLKKRFQQYMQANEQTDNAEELACKKILKRILSSHQYQGASKSDSLRLRDPEEAVSFQEISYTEKKRRLAERKTNFLRLWEVFNDFYQQIDKNESVIIPANLSELKDYQDRLLAPPDCWASTGTLIGCIPCLAFLGCSYLSQEIAILGTISGMFYLASLPLMAIPIARCFIPWVMDVFGDGNATDEINEIKQKKISEEVKVGQLFTQIIESKEYEDFSFILINGYTRSDVENAFEQVRVKLNLEIGEFETVIKQSKLLTFFKLPEKTSIRIMPAEEPVNERSYLLRR